MLKLRLIFTWSALLLMLVSLTAPGQAADIKRVSRQTIGEWAIDQYEGSCFASRDVNYEEGIFNIQVGRTGEVDLSLQAWEEPRDERLVLKGSITIDHGKRLQGDVSIRAGKAYNSYDFGLYDPKVLDWLSAGTEAAVRAGSSLWILSLDGSTQAIRMLRECTGKLSPPSS